ncbi:MAG: hypothetical protein K9J13_10225 [Saprospiraceae bacterium]|nr:hypothetical protein [Saprospiraceae bacterium]
MENYRTDNYFKYIINHSSDIRNNIRKSWLFIAFSIPFLIFTYVINSDIVFVLISFIFLLIFFFVSFVIMSYLIPLSINYSTYRKSAEQYLRIKPFIIKESFEKKAVNRWTEIPFKKMTFNLGSGGFLNQIDFQKVDVFETESSIFLFPIYKYSHRKKDWYTEYLQPIRFRLDLDEIIPDLDDIITITKFTEYLNLKERIIEFYNEQYKIKVKIKIKTEETK